MSVWAYTAAALVGVIVSVPLVGYRIMRVVAHEGVGYVPDVTP